MWGLHAVTVTVGALLVYTGSGKVASPRRLTETLEGLRLSALATPAFVRGLGLAEIGLGWFLAAADWWLVSVLVVVLGTGFAVVGIYAVRKGLHVACNCIGNSDKPLGYRQVALLLVWLLVGWIAQIPGRELDSAESHLVAIAASTLIATLFASVQFLLRVAPVSRERRRRVNGKLTPIGSRPGSDAFGLEWR